MSALSDILYRDEPRAQMEAKYGYIHTAYLFVILCHLLKKLGCEVGSQGNDSVVTGTY